MRKKEKEEGKMEEEAPAQNSSHTCCMPGGSVLVLTPQINTALFARRTSKLYAE